MYIQWSPLSHLQLNRSLILLRIFTAVTLGQLDCQCPCSEIISKQMCLQECKIRLPTNLHSIISSHSASLHTKNEVSLLFQPLLWLHWVKLLSAQQTQLKNVLYLAVVRLSNDHEYLDTFKTCNWFKYTTHKVSSNSQTSLIWWFLFEG